ncbi:MAG: hypothetical protein GAK45_00717 [Pseudomonas citronellolis]|nr:MAG: hypothetical protein GAK45_00717 [Pseudomonas citronellolis]
MRYFILCILLATLCPASAALPTESLSATAQNGTRYRFPHITGDSLAARNINTWLQTVWLNKLPSRYSHVAFEDVWPQAADSYTGLTQLNYSLLANEPGFLSVNLYGEYTFTHPNEFSSSYSFDSRTGQPLQLTDLFTAQGLAWLEQQTLAQRSQRIRTVLAGLSAKTGGRSATEPTLATEQRNLYLRCLTELEGASVKSDNLALDRKTLSLEHRHCGEHLDRTIDVLGDFANRWTFAELHEHLSDYGRCLLVEARSDCQRAPGTLTVGVWRGQIDARLPITLVLQYLGPDGQTHGAYFYDKFARYIGLRGTREQDGSLLLNEDSTPLARMRLKRQGEGFAGSWAQDGKNKTLSVKLD